MSTDFQRGFAAFHYRNYRLFWFGQIISVTGTWMQSLAQAWLVVAILDGSAFDLGLIYVIQFSPVLLLGLVGGVVADRVPKRNLLVVTQSIAGLLAATLAILVATGEVQLWHVYTLAGGLGMTNAFDMPTRQAFLSEIVDREAVMNAIALNSALVNSGRIIGPAIAGVLLATVGPALCFALNAVSYLGVITGLLRMRIAPRVNPTNGSPLARLREGLAYVRASPDILRPIILVGLVGTFGMNFNVWVPLLALQFEAGATGYGLLFAAMGLGSLTGALSLAFFGRGPSRVRMFAGAFALGAVELLLAVVAAVPLPVIIGALCLAGAGFCASSAMATANTTVQTTASQELRGRVMSVYMTVFAGTVPFAALIAGTVADRFSIATAVGLGGTVTAAAAVVIGGWRLGARRGRQPSAISHQPGQD